MERNFDYGKHYREFNDDTDAYAEKMAQASLSELSPWLPLRKDLHVLDIGCGMGFTMLGLTSYGYDSIRGVDVDKTQVEACKRRGLNVELIQDLTHYLHQQDDKFALITMIDVLEHIPKDIQMEVLRGCYSALAPGGRLIVRAPNANSIIASRWRYIDFTHYVSYTESSIKFLLKSCGFEAIQVPCNDCIEPRPSFRPSNLVNGESWKQLKRFIVRRCWRQILILEGGKSAVYAPLGVNLFAIADKSK